MSVTLIQNWFIYSRNPTHHIMRTLRKYHYSMRTYVCRRENLTKVSRSIFRHNTTIDAF